MYLIYILVIVFNYINYSEIYYFGNEQIATCKLLLSHILDVEIWLQI